MRFQAQAAMTKAQEAERVSGVQTGAHKVVSARGGVVLAAGDFTNSPELKGRFMGPQEAKVEGVNLTATGDGQKMAEALGAKILNGDLALDIAGSAPLAVRSIRRTMRGALAEQVRAATDREHAEQQILRRTDDYREGVAATAERRTPKFLGR